MPRVRLLYFASVRERIGCGEELMDLAEQCSDTKLLALLAQRYPQAAAVLGPCRVAHEQAFVRGDFTLCDNAELAIIPPVSGG